MRSLPEVFIFVDPTERMTHLDKTPKQINKVLQFLQLLSRRGDRQPAYLDRIHVHIGTKIIQLTDPNYWKSTQNAREVMFDQSTEKNYWDTYKNVIKDGRNDDDLYFIATTMVNEELLNIFIDYKKANLLFLDFCDKRTKVKIPSKSRVQTLITKGDVKESVKLIHRRLLKDHITKVNIGFEFRTEFQTINRSELDLESLDFFGMTTSEHVETIPVIGSGILVPLDGCYDPKKGKKEEDSKKKKKKPKMSSSIGIQVLKDLLGEDVKYEFNEKIRKGRNSKKRETDRNRKEGTSSGEVKIEDIQASGETPSPLWLLARGKDRWTGRNYPVIVRLQKQKKDKTYEGTPKIIIEVDPNDEPSTSEGPPKLYPELSPGELSPGEIPQWEDSFEDGSIGELVDETFGSNMEEDEEKEEEGKEEQKRDGKVIQCVVLDMPWRQFLTQIALSEDDEALEEVEFREKEVVGVPPFTDYTKLTGWFSAEAMSFYVDKAFRSLRRFELNPSTFGDAFRCMSQMIKYTQNVQLAQVFSQILIADLEPYSEGARVEAENASRFFETLIQKITQPGEPDEPMEQEPEPEPIPPKVPRLFEVPHQSPRHHREGSSRGIPGLFEVQYQGPSGAPPGPIPGSPGPSRPGPSSPGPSRLGPGGSPGPFRARPGSPGPFRQGDRNRGGGQYNRYQPSHPYSQGGRGRGGGRGSGGGYIPRGGPR